MESDKKDKSRQQQEINELEFQDLPQEYEGYQTKTYIRKQNIIREKSRRIKTNDKTPTYHQQRNNNIQNSNVPDNENENYFHQPTRRIDNDSNLFTNQNHTNGKPYNTTDKLYLQQFIHAQDSRNDDRPTKQREEFGRPSFSPNYTRTDGKSPLYSAKYNMSDKSKQQNNMYSSNYRDNLGPINYDNRITQSNSKKMYQQANFELLSNPNNMTVSHSTDDTSLICRAINFHGEPVTVNDKVITNKLILSCKPRRYPLDVSATPEVSIVKKPSVEENVTNYIYSGDNNSVKSPRGSARDPSSVHQKKNYYPTGNLISKTQGQPGETYDTSSYLSANKGVINDPNSLETNGGYYEHHQFKEIECSHLYRNFKSCLWFLFIDSTLLMLVGTILALLAIHYLIFREYLSIVIGEIGFVTWVWTAFFIAIPIIIVGFFGIITSLSRTKPMLKMYVVLAVILLAILILVTIIFMVQYSTLKKDAVSETERTFLLYRCVRRIRVAWDSMMEVFHCCGKNTSKDWKYVPPACCNATSKAGKLACIGHFIQPAQAFEEGCLRYLHHYYFILFLVILIFILLAILLLIIGILCTFRLHQMYSNILICRDKFYIR